MEYLQVKTPAIEKWEKEMEEILHNGEFKTDAVLSCWEKEYVVFSGDACWMATDRSTQISG
jgi:hypothetical protein